MLAMSGSVGCTRRKRLRCANGCETHLLPWVSLPSTHPTIRKWDVDGVVNAHALVRATPNDENNVGAGFTPARGRASAVAKASGFAKAMPDRMAGQVKPSPTGVFSR